MDPRARRERGVAWREAVSGLAAGIASRSITAPLDLIKIRFQLQVEPTRGGHAGYFTGIWRSLVKVAATEGPASLWRGNLAGNLLYMSYAPVQFAAFAQMRAAAADSRLADESGELTAVGAAALGAAAGTMATFVSYPFDVLRTQTAACDAAIRPTGALAASARAAIAMGGTRALYRGVVTAMASVAPAAAIQLLALERARAAFADPSGRLSPTASAAAGLVGGTASKLLVYPLDLVKKRLQMLNAPRPARFGAPLERYSGLGDCLRRTVAGEGVLGLYKGIVPALIKVVPATVVTFVVYEETMRLVARVET